MDIFTKGALFTGQHDNQCSVVMETFDKQPVKNGSPTSRTVSTRQARYTEFTLHLAGVEPQSS